MRVANISQIAQIHLWLIELINSLERENDVLNVVRYPPDTPNDYRATGMKATAKLRSSSQKGCRNGR